MAIDTYALTTLAELKTYMGISASTWDTVLENLIDSASARVEAYIGRRIKSRTWIEHIDPDGSSTIRLKQWPVTSVDFIGVGARPVISIGFDSSQSSIIVATAQWDAAGQGGAGTLTLKTGTATGDLTATTDSTLRSTASMAALSVTGFAFTLIESVRADWLHQQGPVNVIESPMQLTYPAVTDVDCRVDRDRGILHRPRWSDDWDDGWDSLLCTGWRPRFGFSPQSMVVQYTAGYSTIPYDVEQTVQEVAAAMFRSRARDETLNSESLGDYSYTSGGASRITEILEERLGSWREIR